MRSVGRRYHNDAAATVDRLRGTNPWMSVAGMPGSGECGFMPGPEMICPAEGLDT